MTTSKSLLKMAVSGAGILCIVLLALEGCKKDLPSALYVPGGGSGAQPIVTSITPGSGALAGITMLQMDGSNFSPNPGDNFVYFDTAQAIILTATPTVLTFRAPNVPKDSIYVRVSVVGAQRYSPTFLYGLQSAALILDSLDTNEDPKTLANDALGNLYASIEPSSGGATVGVFPPAGGRRTSYAPVFAGSAKSFSGMKMGPGGVLYLVIRQNRIMTVPTGGGAATPWVSNIGLRTETLADLDFDSLKNVWTAGTNSNVYRVTPGKAVKAFSFVSAIRSVRVFQGYLYLGGLVSSDEGVWRFQIISSDSLGPVEQYFDFGAAYPTGGRVNAITFSADGDLYIACDEQYSIVIVHPDKTSEQLYPGVLKLQSIAFSWGPGNVLFVARHDQSAAAPPQHAIIRVNAQKPGAPYYGIQ